MSGKYKAVASGAITNGKPVIVNADGTVGEISATGLAVAGSGGARLSVGPFNGSDDISGPEIIYDTTRNKALVVYKDSGNSDDLTGNLLTVSGTGVTKGSDVEITTNNLFMNRLVYDSNAEMSVVIYRDNSSSGYSRSNILSGSGATLTVSNPINFRSSSSSPMAITFDSNVNRIAAFYNASGSTSGTTDKIHCITGEINGATSITWRGNIELTNGQNTSAGFNPGADACFDSNSNRVVLVYQDSNNSSYGTAIVGTFAGDGESISFGSPVVFSSSNTQALNTVFDSSTNKVVVAYSDAGNSYDGKAVVGTVSGTSISFGSTNTFYDSVVYSIGLSFDSNANKIHLFHDGYTTIGTAKAIEGTVSGTSISFSSAVNFNGSNSALAINAVFDPDTNQSIVAFTSYGDGVTDGDGSIRVYTPASTSTNITSENYIGIASGGTYPTAAEATIDVVGTVNKDQSGLTAGQTYFVQTDGTLGTSAGDPSVVAGTAISATELIVKG